MKGSMKEKLPRMFSETGNGRSGRFVPKVSSRAILSLSTVVLLFLNLDQVDELRNRGVLVILYILQEVLMLFDLMGFELGLEKPDPRRALQSAFTIALAYILGGLVPLIPYMFISNVKRAVTASVALTLVALLVFGYAKGYFTGNKPFKSAIQTTLIGAIASAAAFGMAKAIQQ
ncbi:vacuolar iron transporter 1 [Cucumis melo var. makuwa]|uniref:Vacuolar iron transporter n=1 Tax=Cucumis melo var. makuwa TaxID=1194695 RepID=A0A5D3D9Z4_CUCMM|nr:vacuolar iron transporter 1 [Cucumis melo var. makuwa]